MKKVIKIGAILACGLLLTGCGNYTTTYKTLPWSKFIESKTIVLADTVCKEHIGYYQSVQTQVYNRWTQTSSYGDVTIRCQDGFVSIHNIGEINAIISPKVAEILK
jgi:hypothetical protein